MLHNFLFWESPYIYILCVCVCVFLFCDGPITQTHTPKKSLWMDAHNYQQVPPQIASYRMKNYIYT
jgi:hypothetical protein